MQRPELMMGTVEFLVPKDYWNKQPVGLQWLFLIDATQESVQRGFLKGVCKGILDALYDTSENPEDERRIPEGSKIGIVTYNREVQFYNLSVCSQVTRVCFIANMATAATGPCTDDGDDGPPRTVCSAERRPFCGSL
jgi:hypothetical protein